MSYDPNIHVPGAYRCAKCGQPKHPLMLGYDSPILEWRRPV